MPSCTRSRSSGSRAARVAVLLVLAFGLGARRAPAQSPDEQVLWAIWSQQQKEPAQHQAIIDACAQFATAQPASPYLPVTRGLAIWHLLKIGQRDAATQMLQSMLTDSAEPVARAGHEMARRWLTRLDREKVRAALQAFYVDQVEYPGSIDALRSLPESQRPPMTDRWGKAWAYRLVNFRHIEGVKAQKYQLESPTLGATSDLAAALKQPYAATIGLKPVRRMGTGGEQAVVEFATTGANPQPVVLTAGTSYGAVIFVRMGAGVLVLSDGDYWLPVPPPKS